MKVSRITFTDVSIGTVNKFTEFLKKESFIHNERNYALRFAISGVEIKEEERKGDYSGNFEVSFALVREYEKHLHSIHEEATNKLFLDLLLRVVQIFNTPL